MTVAVRFDWHELQTRDCERALRFYQAFCGWTTADATAGSSRERHLCSLDGVALGAVTVSQAPGHVPAFWLPYLAVADLDESLAQARASGARVLRGPGSAAGGGRSAALIDPRGALFGLREGAAALALPRPRAPDRGVFCWDELLTDDAESSAAFYATLTGGSIETLDLGPMGVYRMLVIDGQRIAGMMKHPENVPPHWLPYIAVDDVDAQTRRAVELGASLYFPPRDIPGGRVSGIDDPTGAGVCLLHGSI